MYFELDNKIEATIELEQIVGSIASEFNLTESIMGDIRLALEEIIVNTIMYGYKEGESDRIKILAERMDDCLSITIEDGGVAFDPTIVSDPDLDVLTSDDSIGGLGIYLVKNSMDSVVYERVNERNRLIITKNI